GFQQGEGARFRIEFKKRGRAAFISHLDLMRLTIRVFRRAGVELIYSKGFHPKPQLVFAPALGLGIAALGELCDVRAEFDGDGDALAARLRPFCPEGMEIDGARRLGADELGLAKVIGIAELAAWVPTPVTLRAPGVVKRVQKGVVKQIDVAKTLIS